jgi:cytochrome c553
MKLAAILLSLLTVSLSAQAADDRFFKEKPGSMNGFLAARDPLYVKECGSCHFPYSPGLLPARSWERHFQRLDKHFGEIVQLNDATRASLRKFLTENAADVSPYEGSKTFMEQIKADKTPYRFSDVPLFHTMHRIVLAVIDAKPKIRERKLTNCSGCHQMADEGSFGLEELAIPGLTRTTR